VRHAPEDSDLAMRVLGCSQCLVASPALVASLGMPRAPADLLSWLSLGHGASLEGHHRTLLGPDGARVKQHHSPRFATTDMQTLRQGAIDGLGVATAHHDDE
jgi:DNA-binding transcriptional LysR family regulator